MEKDNIQIEDPQDVARETATAETTDIAETQEENTGYSPDDAILERAVKAGMTLADAKQLPSKEFAERMLGALEAKGAKAGRTDAGSGDGDGEPAIDFSGFSEEDGYDPNIVKAMNSLKALVEYQNGVIKKLSAGGSPKVAKAAESRKNLVLARPGGETGRSRVATPQDAEAEILSKLRDKFKLN